MAGVGEFGKLPSLSTDEETVLRQSVDYLIDLIWKPRCYGREIVTKGAIFDYIKTACMVAKAEFDEMTFGGVDPAEGEFGIRLIPPATFGLTTWEKDYTTAGTWTDWTAPTYTTPKDSVHVIIGAGNYAEAPKVLAYKEEVGRKTYVIKYVEYKFRLEDLKLFISPVVHITRPQTKLYIRVKPFYTGTDAFFPFGFEFRKGKDMADETLL